ncbi:MASE4 domain-containing protein [Rhodoplanes sp. Z2-YC6860]|uniref:MASE4 domain-containing protein n=1 Tax=Rhodoplanes sp. Z2-YC6860 TaxID=674703 RepID=UPI00082F69FF|nr:MASE4 domain-containing protein [Rhodoplanes sp. Z2-YC6860]
MAAEHANISEEELIFASSLSPGRVQKRAALLIAFGILAAFFIIISLSNNEQRPFPGFILVFVSSMLVCDFITAILLFSQYSILRSPAILVVANGYVFTALILIGWTLTFPGSLLPDRPYIGALQSASGFYIAWRSGFAAFVIGYALSKDAHPTAPRWTISVRSAVAVSLLLTVAVVGLISLLCLEYEPLLPHIMEDSLHYSPAYPYAVGIPNCSLSIIALALLWIRRRSTLDLWLMVVMFFYAMDMPLSYFPSPGRFTDGWYAVRFITFLTSIIILVLLLYEISSMYGRLLSAVFAQRREREARLVTRDAVAAIISHEIKQPLSAMITRAETSLRWLDRPVPDIEKAKAELKHVAADGYRAGAVIESIRANFKKDARIRTSFNINDLIAETISLVRADLQRHRIQVEAEPQAELPQVMGDRIQLQQVLLNLITNAIDAMAVKDGPRILAVSSRIRNDGGVVVSVADTGHGIGAHDIDRLFNPLFTTKSNGMGMGLSICRSIMEAHEGELLAVPKALGGAEFQFVLRTVL